MSTSWNDARQMCASLGWYMVELQTEEEYLYIDMEMDMIGIGELHIRNSI